MSEGRGLALLCGPGGDVMQVLSPGSDLIDVVTQTPFSSWLDAGSRSKAEAMFSRLRKGEPVIDWELIVRGPASFFPMRFSGAPLEGSVVLLGIEPDRELTRFTDQLMQINNEHVNALRDALKQLAALQQRARRSAEGAVSAVERLGRVNSELTNAQRELAQKNAQLQRVIDEKRLLMGMVAHDLRNPLQAIHVFTELLLREPVALEPNARTLLEHMRGSTGRMRTLINDLLDLAQIEAGHLLLRREVDDLLAMVQRCIALHDGAAQIQGVRVVLDASGLADHDAVRLRSVSFDSPKLQQVLDNLIGNAVKHTSPGDEVCVGLTCSTDLVHIAVRDQGPGIPPEDLPRLFEPYQMGAPTPRRHGTQGAGLGLAIARRIVTGHGGTLSASSEVGVGSTFVLELPLAATSAAVTGGITHDTPITATTAPQLRLLLVDDDRLGLLAVQKLLESVGHLVHLATDEDEAAALLRVHTIDVALVDLELRDARGEEVAGRLQVLAPDALFLALTGHAPQQVRERLQHSPFRHCLGKPFQISELLNAVRGTF